MAACTGCPQTLQEGRRGLRFFGGGRELPRQAPVTQSLSGAQSEHLTALFAAPFAARGLEPVFEIEFALALVPSLLLARAQGGRDRLLRDVARPEGHGFFLLHVYSPTAWGLGFALVLGPMVMAMKRPSILATWTTVMMSARLLQTRSRMS